MFLFFFFAELGSDTSLFACIVWCSRFLLEKNNNLKKTKKQKKTQNCRPYVSMLAELGSDIVLVFLFFGFLEVCFWKSARNLEKTTNKTYTLCIHAG